MKRNWERERERVRAGALKKLNRTLLTCAVSEDLNDSLRGALASPLPPVRHLTLKRQPQRRVRRRSVRVSWVRSVIVRLHCY